MAKPRVLVSTDWISDVLADALSGLDIEIVRGTPNVPPGPTIYAKEDWPELFGNTDIAVVSPITVLSREMMEAAPRLKAIMSPVIGVESIDVDAATDLGIIVGHGATPENFLGMSEATMLLISALAMQLPYKEQLLRDNAPRPKVLTACSVRNRTIGLIGMGRIARGVVDRLQGWETEILYFDPYVEQDQAPAGTKKVDMETLLKSSDFVSVHVTVTDETKAMIGAPELAMMKPTAYLVNTARGAALDEQAVYEALKNGTIAGAGLDAFVDEPLPVDSPLRELDNVILTPHMLGHSKDVMDSLPVAALANVGNVMKNEPPLYTKNPQVIEKWKARIASMG
ncbi:MAG TPA: dehydrogenase [Gammaproteobacteria bacterium]|nr:dehydrogenase [Gammaproteobacteria bacterium]